MFVEQLSLSVPLFICSTLDWNCVQGREDARTASFRVAISIKRLMSLISFGWIKTEYGQSLKSNKLLRVLTMVKGVQDVLRLPGRMAVMAVFPLGGSGWLNLIVLLYSLSAYTECRQKFICHVADNELPMGHGCYV